MLLFLWLANLSQQTKILFKVGNKATNILMSLLWYLDMLLCIWLEDGLFLRKVSGFSYKQNTVDNCSVMKELCYILTWKIPKVLVELFFHKSPGWFLLKVLQQIRPCSKSATEKRVERFQLMLIGCLYNYLETYFWSMWRSILLVKLQAFPLNSTGNRFLRVYCRDQDTY